jgi:hypothetical protein
VTEKGTGVRHGPSKRIAHVIGEGCFKWRIRKKVETKNEDFKKADAAYQCETRQDMRRIKRPRVKKKKC